MLSPSLKGMFYAAVAYGLFSTSDALVKLLSLRLSIFEIISIQSVFAILPLLILIQRRGGFGTLRAKEPKLIVLRAVCAGVGTVCGYYGFSTLPLADVYALIFCAPMLVTILSIYVLGETVRLYRWLAVIVGFIGVLIMVAYPNGFSMLALGHIAALIAAFAGAITIVVMRRLGGNEQPLLMLVSIMLGYLVVSVPMGIYLFKLPTALEFLMLAASGTMVASAQFFVILALTQTPASTIAPIQYTQMIWAIFYGVVIFSTPIQSSVMLGMLLIVGSSLYTLHRERQHGHNLQTYLK